MKYETLIDTVLDRFPDVREYFSEEQRKFPEDTNSISVNVFFSHYFDKILFLVIDNYDDDLEKEMFNLVEEMLCSEDSRIVEVAEFTVLEEICCAYPDFIFIDFLGPKTTLALEKVRRYAPEEEFYGVSIKCPVCGQYLFEKKDDYEVCPICNWENDGYQRSHPDEDGGANRMSLKQARKAWKSGKKVL